MSIARNDIEIHFVVEGEGEGEPVTLIHGVGANLGGWDRVTERLVPEFKVIRMDLRGHGGSGRIVARCDLDDFVADVAAVLDGAGIGRTDIVGFSLGGMIAQGFTLAYPERVNRLALISTVAGRTPEERRKVMDRAEKVCKEGIASVVAAAEERWFTPEFRKSRPDMVENRLGELLANDPASYAEAYRVFAESDVGDRLHEISHRTLVVTGENDVGSNTRMARFMHEQIPGSELIILPKLRHGVLVEASDTVASLLADFLRPGGIRTDLSQLSALLGRVTE